MSSSREGPNPLRPYYIPPSIGLPSPSPEAAAASSVQVLGSSARELLPDIEYSDYFESTPSGYEWLKDVLDGALKRYLTTLTSQPFDVSKTILQAYVVPDEDSIRAKPRSQAGNNSYDDAEASQSSDDESSYFTSAAPTSPSPSTPRSQRPRHHITDRTGYIPSPVLSPKYALTLHTPSSLMEVLGQLWSTTGPTSLWKASNATFIYNLLLPTLNTFIRSLLSAIVGLPEEAIASSMTADILTAASPVATLILSFISSALSAMILSPIDTARTFLILTPSTRGPRSLLRAIKLIPTPNHTIPAHLIPITVLHSSLPNFIMTTAPLFLKSYLSIDPVLNPSMWSLFSFLSSSLELAVRYPLETVLRRAQIATFTSPSFQQKRTVPLRTTSTSTPSTSPTPPASPAPNEIQTIVPTERSYRGIVGTMWSIVYEEGISPVPTGSETAHELLHKRAARGQGPARRRGQGIQGLYRGWRTSMWGVAGIWAASLAGPAAGGGEDETMVSGMSASRGRGRMNGGRF